MAYPTRYEDACAAICAAREQVAEAMEGYSQGGSLSAVNRAQRALADAHASYREVCGGNVPDRR